MHDDDQVWEKIRAQIEGGTIGILAESACAREVIKATLLFRGFTNIEVLDKAQYQNLISQPDPQLHLRVLIADSEPFFSEDPLNLDASKELEDKLDPTRFDSRICENYVLMVSYKYRHCGKSVILSASRMPLRVVFCGENPIRRRNLAQALLASTLVPQAEVLRRAALEGQRDKGNAGLPLVIPQNDLRILLCEDNLVNVAVLTRQLKKLGYTNYDITYNGADGLRAFTEREYDLILMDCQMPVLDGYEATIAIRKLELDRRVVKHVPIVALTASAMPEEKERGLRAGMDAYLSKPMLLAVLKDVLDRVAVIL